MPVIGAYDKETTTLVPARIGCTILVWPGSVRAQPVREQTTGGLNGHGSLYAGLRRSLKLKSRALLDHSVSVRARL
jgi:hypothetical protein